MAQHYTPIWDDWPKVAQELNDQEKGRLIDIEHAALQMGYQRMYLETHTNLEAAVHLYEKCGFHQIPKPDFVIHSTMNRFYLKEL